MSKKIINLLLTSSLILLACIGCTDSGGGDDSGSTPPAPGGGENTTSFRTDCGTVVDGAIQNPASSSDGLNVTIVRAGTDGSVIVLRDGGQQLVKLRAISENPSSLQSSKASSIISTFPQNALLFTDDCQAFTSSGGRAVVGDLYSITGKSLIESLLTQNGAAVDASGGCGESLVSTCYQALIESTPVETGGNVSNFLWKPQSERNGLLVVLLNPAGATVVVNGETLSSSGPSNGRGTTARANKSGGAFGSNITLQAFDSLGRPLVFPGGETSFTIANGSQRVEF